jgi:hypothetical protein
VPSPKQDTLNFRLFHNIALTKNKEKHLRRSYIKQNINKTLAMLMRLTDPTVGREGSEMQSFARVKYLPSIYLYNTIFLLGENSSVLGNCLY